MATSWRVGVLLTRTYAQTQTAILSKAKHIPSALSNLESIRGRRQSGSCKYPYRPTGPRKYADYLQKPSVELLPENVSFLKELHAADYEGRNSPLRDEPWERQEWTFKTMRSGVLAIKIGTQPMWTKEGRKFMTTLLQVIDNHAIQYMPPEEFANTAWCKPAWRRVGFGMQVIGALGSEPFKYSRNYNDMFNEAGVPTKRKLTRFIVTPNAAVQPGTPLTVNHFRVGDYVDCQAKTIGHGFQGVVKRWGFKGGPASHGSTKFQRRPGSSAGGGDKAGVWKGKKMPGKMGMKWRTLRGLKIWRINTEYNVLYVTGSNVPGPIHCYVRIMDSMLWPHIKSRFTSPPNLPTWIPEDVVEKLPEDIYDDEMLQFSAPTVLFDEPKSK